MPLFYYFIVFIGYIRPDKPIDPSGTSLYDRGQSRAARGPSDVHVSGGES